MKLAVVTNDSLKQELLAAGVIAETELCFFEKPSYCENADAYIDLLFVNDPARLEEWKKINPSLLIINEVVHNSSFLPPLVRINGWPGFLKRHVIEAATNEPLLKQKCEQVFSSLNRKIEWVPDIDGLITPRIISMIINEAYYALSDKVSTKEEIDIAMKLGTNYPHGPFEWSAIIGLNKVHSLLSLLCKTEGRYCPAELLASEAKKK